MMIVIRNVLQPKEVASIVERLSAAAFVDGKLTAGAGAKDAKQNLQLKRGSDEAKELEAVVVKALTRNNLFQMAAVPKRILPPIFSRYDEHMHYGTHVDNPFMDKGTGVARTDLALTLFLSERDSYDGGELVIETATGDNAVKLDSGGAVIYPAANLHRVNKVSRGVRLAAVTWVQCLVRDPWQREVLYDLGLVLQWAKRAQPDAKELNLLSKVHGNLMRMWSDL